MSAIHEILTPDDPSAEDDDLPSMHDVVRAYLSERDKLLREAGLAQDSKENWIIPKTDCGGKDYYSTVNIANCRSFIKKFKPWVAKSPDGADDVGAVIRKHVLLVMPVRIIKEIIEDIEGLDNYCIHDDDEHSKVERELEEEAWQGQRMYFRELVKDYVLPYFEDKYTPEGQSIEEMADELLDSDELIDEFFYEYQRESSGDTWDFGGQGSGPCLRLNSIESDITRARNYNDNKQSWIENFVDQVRNKLFPEDPRQMTFRFAERIVSMLLASGSALVEATNAAKVMVSTMLEDAGPHKFSCVMIKLPQELASEIVAWGKQQIPNEQLYVDEDGGCGREEEQHVTVKYGLHDAMPSDALKQIFATTAPFDISLEPITLFRNEGFDVVKMAVKSPQLHEFNRRVSDACECTDTYPDYIPHVTIAYVKAGTCDRLEGMSPFDHDTKMGVTSLIKDGVFSAKTVDFSSRTGIKKDYNIGPVEAPAEETA